MSSAYFASLVLRPVIITAPGEYITRAGERVRIEKITTQYWHNFGCVGYYADGTVDFWHKSGRIFAGRLSGNDIVGVVP